MRICIYPGTFDPITNGHLDVVARAARLFDKVIVAVADNPGKGPLFSVAERMRLIEENLAPWPNVVVDSFPGLLVEFARERGAVAIIRGLRALSDFEFEFQMALMNRHLDHEIETIFVMTKDAYSYTSSRLVKQVSRFGADIAPFVPPNVIAALDDRRASNDEA
ncbi:pantetheine-phosphate adenylyltransferase [Opitutales bacterium ASA1]|uniref:pantetheine-phosphate adenylyltransferase n=1 Tax=Congregicoccus parvus TaxID=3081749 RepID=UPI002B2C08E8|nr:pantetheine-phosphate adenylyltransferase [Opitutales bacterium ASA1]